jgi:hypothetical protein
MRRRTLLLSGSLALVVLVVASVVAGIAGRSAGLAPVDRARSEQEREAEEAGRGGGAEELQEQLEGTQDRLDALKAARANGTFGEKIQIQAAPVAGWAGEQVVDPTADDWEPAIAADPNAPLVYLITTRYGAPKPCPGNCPTPYIALEISSDGGATWGASTPLCACKGSGQFDPIIEVVPGTGWVYALYMNGFNVVFTKSTDHGQTWSTPVPTWGNVSWNDKPVIAMSNDGRDVYVSWNGPQGGDPWIAQSHDFGSTWTQTKVVDGPRYFFAYDADVLNDGTVVFSESSIDYGGPGGSAVRSRKAGAAAGPRSSRNSSRARWQNVLLARLSSASRASRRDAPRTSTSGTAA